MEHLNNIFKELSQKASPDAIEKLIKYSNMIHEENQKYNLTGFKILNEIAANLVFESINPLININVPRGTFFVDIGCGAGVPGIPLGIMSSDMRGVLIDSNKKKTAFVSNVIKSLEISNLSVVNGRVEELANLPEFRQRANFVVCRAFAEPYVALEMGVPLLAVGGLLYLFSKFTVDELERGIVEHGVRLGVVGVERAEMGKYGFPEVGLLFVKTKSTPVGFPRRFSVVRKYAGSFRKQDVGGK